MKISMEQKVGLFFLVSLIILAVMIELVEEWQPFEKQNRYHTYFTSAVGLNVGDPVRMAGVEVGKFKIITIDGLISRHADPPTNVDVLGQAEALGLIQRERTRQIAVGAEAHGCVL